MIRDWIVKDYDWCVACTTRVAAPEHGVFCGRCIAEIDDDLTELTNNAG